MSAHSGSTSLTLMRPIDRFGALVALVGVGVYRRWISPHKGFVCAHGALTGEPSCAEYAARTLRRHTLSESIPLIRLQFERCRATYRERKQDLLDRAADTVSRLGVIAGGAGVLACQCIPDDGSDKNSTPPIPVSIPVGQEPQLADGTNEEPVDQPANA